jgi:hypothetical protein
MHPMLLLGDEAQVDAHFIPFGDSANLEARFAPNVPYDQKSFWMHPMALLGDEAKVEA